MQIGMVLRLALAALFMTVATAAWPETLIRKSVTYFSIGGKTAEDLDTEMMRRGPLSRLTGRRHPGATQIHFSGSATFASKGTHCQIKNAKVSLSTKLILPRWVNRRRANADMALIWDTLSSDIKRHEERHAEIARNHARSLEQKILMLGPAFRCETLKKKVNDLSRNEMDLHDSDQQRFDRIEAANFENRMIRLLQYRLEKKKRPE